MRRMFIEFTVNDDKVALEVDNSELLVYVLREKVGVTGTNVGCLTGDCGACTVRLDGATVKSCSVLAVEVDGCRVETIEALKQRSSISDLQASFISNAGFQCGYCLPGMLLTAQEHIDACSAPTRESVREAIDGNLCRCTGYTQIVDSVLGSISIDNNGSSADED